MLTQSEKAWLERREEMPGYYCLWCPLWDNEADCDGRSPHPFCPMFNRREWLMGALVFEARVAALIAELYADKFADVVLKHARLQVEEDMDAEG